MAHNRSPSKIRSDVLCSPLVVYRGWQLQVECSGPSCPKGHAYRIEALAQRFPDDTVGEAINRLRCSTCRTGPWDVVLIEVLERRRVPLRGPQCSYLPDRGNG